jgi:hypothetical protein
MRDVTRNDGSIERVGFMIQNDRYLLILTLVIGMFIVSSCTSNSSSSPSPSPPSGTQPAQGSPGSASNGVTLDLASTTYHTSDTLRITLKNSGSQPIFFPDHLTNCTVLLLEYQVNGSWQAIDNCGTLNATRWHMLSPQQQLEVTLSPPAQGWATGHYRLKLVYHVGQRTAPPQTLYSVIYQVS